MKKFMTTKAILKVLRKDYRRSRRIERIMSEVSISCAKSWKERTYIIEDIVEKLFDIDTITAFDILEKEE